MEDSVMKNEEMNSKTDPLNSKDSLPEKWVNLEDIAVHLSLSEDTVRAWVKDGKLPFYRAGKRYKFKISEVDEWVRKGKIKE
jgi:excisionase family DNA binding protein